MVRFTFAYSMCDGDDDENVLQIFLICIHTNSIIQIQCRFCFFLYFLMRVCVCLCSLFGVQRNNGTMPMRCKCHIFQQFHFKVRIIMEFAEFPLTWHAINIHHWQPSEAIDCRIHVFFFIVVSIFSVRLALYILAIRAFCAACTLLPFCEREVDIRCALHLPVNLVGFYFGRAHNTVGLCRNWRVCNWCTTVTTMAPSFVDGIRSRNDAII